MQVVTEAWNFFKFLKRQIIARFTAPFVEVWMSREIFEWGFLQSLVFCWLKKVLIDKSKLKDGPCVKLEYLHQLKK